VPVFSYFLIIGSVLTGLLFYANSVMVPEPLPFSISQTIGLPKPYKAPTVIVESPTPAVIATTIEQPVEAKKPVKVVRRYKTTRVVRQTLRQERYAADPLRPSGSIW
jgi:hypothetical protein